MAKAAQQETETDPFATARSTFVRLGDLEDRAVLIVPTAIQTGIQSTRKGGEDYDRIVADVIVLDGDPDENLGLDEIPTTIEGMFITGAVAVPQLRPSLKSHRPVLGVVTKQASRTKGNNDAVALVGDSVTEDQRALARTAWDAYKASQEDPFATAS
jgi:hypothetical protein